MGKLAAEEGRPWVEILPKALRAIHDVPGESGLTPYEIVFGRQRPLAGIPYRPEREAEGATAFLKKMEEQDRWVSKVLQEQQARRANQENKKRKEPSPLPTGSKVGYQPEKKPGADKLEPKWKGPAIVKKESFSTRMWWNCGPALANQPIDRSSRHM